MVPEEWPIAVESADHPVDPVRMRGPSRLSTVRRDFFLNPSDRLTEQERALMTAMLHDLIGSVAAEILAAAGARPSDLQPERIAEKLGAAGLIDRAGLISLMLRRSDEHRIASAFANHAGPRKLPMLPRLVGDSDPRIAATAMGLVVARGRRRDGFGQPRVELSDLHSADASAVTNAVAAAISPDARQDARFARAAATVVSAIDPEHSLDKAVALLIDALSDAGRDDEDVLADASGEGEVAIAAQLIGRKAGIGPQAAWDHLVNAGEGGLALLARMAGLGRKVAARLIADLGATVGATSIEEEIARFDTLSDGEVAAQRAHWELPREYRNARIALGAPRG
jgi:hypothetical protein